jgi:hypothetical protein
LFTTIKKSHLGPLSATMTKEVNMMNLAEMVVKNSKEKVPLGALLLADDIIIPQDLDLALEHQKYTKEPIGEILVKIGALEHDDLDKFLKLQSIMFSH